MPDGIMDGFFSTVLEQASYSGRNRGIFLQSRSKTVSICFQPSFGSIRHHLGADLI